MKNRRIPNDNNSYDKIYLDFLLELGNENKLSNLKRTEMIFVKLSFLSRQSLSILEYNAFRDTLCLFGDYIHCE